MLRNGEESYVAHSQGQHLTLMADLLHKAKLDREQPYVVDLDWGIDALKRHDEYDLKEAKRILRRNKRKS